MPSDHDDRELTEALAHAIRTGKSHAKALARLERAREKKRPVGKDPRAEQAEGRPAAG